MCRIITVLKLTLETILCDTFPTSTADTLELRNFRVAAGSACNSQFHHALCKSLFRCKVLMVGWCQEGRQLSCKIWVRFEGNTKDGSDGKMSENNSDNNGLNENFLPNYIVLE